MTSRSLPNALIARASIQGGVVSLAQLRQYFSRHQVARMKDAGLLRSETHGVYRLPSVTAAENAKKRIHPLDWGRLQRAWTGLLSAEGARATGLAALAIHGVWGLPPEIVPEISMAGGRAARGAKGVRVRQFRAPFDVVRIHGYPVAAPMHALAQALPELNRYQAVAVVDSAINRGIISPDAVMDLKELLRGRHGAPLLGRWFELVDGRAESPMETFARLDCHLAGLPPPILQVEHRDEAGALIARSDLGWQRRDGTWVLVEIDGREVHDAPRALYRDRDRQNRLLLHGRHTVLHFTGQDVMQRRVSQMVRPFLAELHDLNPLHAA